LEGGGGGKRKSWHRGKEKVMRKILRDFGGDHGALWLRSKYNPTAAV